MNSPTFLLSEIFTEAKKSIRLALPLVTSEVIYALNGFFATVMIGHLSKDHLAANSLVWSIYSAVILFFLGILVSTSILVSQSFGAKDHKGISTCFKQGLIMSIIFALPMMFIIWLAPVVLIWTGQDPVVISLANPLFRALIWSILPLNVMVIIQQFLIGLTKTRLVMVMSLLAIPIEISFYYIFLFGKLGMPKLGLQGIGYGLTLSYSLIDIYFICYLFFSKQFRIYKLFAHWWSINRKFFFEMINVGMPLGIMFAIEVAFLAAESIMMGKFGISTLAAYQIAQQYFFMALVVIFGLNQTVTVRIGYEVGQNNRSALKLVSHVNIGIGLLLMSLFSIFFITFPHAAIKLIIGQHSPSLASVTKEATIFLNIISILIFIECIRFISTASLRGLKDTKFPLLVSAIGFWCIAFPGAYLLAFKFHFGSIGIWGGLALGIFVAAIMLAARFSRLVKRIDLVALVTRD